MNRHSSAVEEAEMKMPPNNAFTRSSEHSAHSRFGAAESKDFMPLQDLDFARQPAKLT